MSTINGFAGVPFRHVALALSEMPVGNSRRQEIESVSLNNLRGSTGLLLTGATTPTIEVSSNQLRANFVASGTAQTATMLFTVPRSYDNIKKANGQIRRLLIQVQAYMAGTTDSPTLSLAAVALPGLSGDVRTSYVATTVNPASTGTSTNHVISGVTPRAYVFNLGEAVDGSGTVLKPGDEVTLTFTLGAHSTNAAYFGKISACAHLAPNFTNKTARNSAEGDEQH